MTLKEQAKVLASTIETDLGPDDLTDILLSLAWDWPTKRDRYHLALLLSQIPIVKEYHRNPFPITRLPGEVPLPPPFNTQETASLLLSAIRRIKTDILKIENLKKYLKENEEDILVRMIKQGPENVVYLDAPEYVTHALITRKLKPRLIRILDDRDERIRIRVI